MEDIRNLCRYTKEELFDILSDETKMAYEAGVYTEDADDEMNEHLEHIENIIYVLRNCNYKDEDEDEDEE